MSPKVTSEAGRDFSCFPAAVLVFLVDDSERFFLFCNRAGDRSIVSGGIESNETILDSARREVSEEVGEQVKASPVGVVHAHRFHYDAQVRDMISIYYLFHYRGGEIVPGSNRSFRSIP